MPKQPNSDHCFVCGRNNPRGLRMVFHDDGELVTSQTSVDGMFQGYPGIVHGGVVAAMLDEVVARVAMVADHMHFLMSVRLAVKFRLPTPTSSPIRLLGRRIRDRGRFTEAQAQLLLPDGRIAADAEVALADLPAALREQFDPERLGWRVDP